MADDLRGAAAAFECPRVELQLKAKWGTLARVIIHLVLLLLQYVMFVYETSAISPMVLLQLQENSK